MPPLTKPRMITVCLVCRIKRKKCDKAKPECQNCRSSGAKCVYSTRKRDMQTGRVSRGTEETAEGSESADAEVEWHPEDPINNESIMHDEDPEQPVGQAPEGPVFPEEPVLLPPDQLVVLRGSQIRNISKTFWGFVSGQDRLGEAILFDEDKRPADLPPSHISSVSLAKVLTSIPTKPVCDALFQNFLISVYPIHPLVDIPVFQSEYEAFWQWAAEGSLHPPAKLIADPTFTCLLFAVLCSGAFVIPISMWQDSSSPLAAIEQKTTIEQLRAACSASLIACQHTGHPTINTLAASLLANQTSNETPLESSLFISGTIRLAQSMGLHRPCGLVGFSSSREYRNRVWSHIMWLDVQSSVASGLPTCRHSTLKLTEDRSLGHLASLYAHGRDETALQQSLLMRNLQPDPFLQSNEGYQITSLSIQVFLKNMKEHISLLDKLIDLIPVQQAEQHDPMHLWENTSPQTHRFLYEDNRNEPNVFSAWVKTMLSLLKLESIIMLQKLFLGSPDFISNHKFWSCTARLCIQYLQVYSTLCHTPVFEPYAWFFSEYFAPRQCSLLILIYLKHHPRPENGEIARGLVNEFLDYVCARKSSDNHSSKLPLDIQALVSFREEIDFKLLFQSGPFGASSESTARGELSFTELPVENRSAVSEIFDAFENWTV